MSQFLEQPGVFDQVIRLGEEETTPRTEQHDDSVRELRLLEPLDLGESMDLTGSLTLR